jgi:hypothetical protein
MKRGIAAAAIVSGLLAATLAAEPQVRVGDSGLMFFPVLIPVLQGAPTGGVQLDVDPRSAQVYVDGTRVGVIRDFSGYYRHLELSAGPHLVTIVAPSYEPLTISVVVSPGHTLTYRGALTRAYGR